MTLKCNVTKTPFLSRPLTVLQFGPCQPACLSNLLLGHPPPRRPHCRQAGLLTVTRCATATPSALRSLSRLLPLHQHSSRRRSLPSYPSRLSKMASSERSSLTTQAKVWLKVPPFVFLYNTLFISFLRFLKNNL